MGAVRRHNRPDKQAQPTESRTKLNFFLWDQRLQKIPPSHHRKSPPPITWNCHRATLGTWHHRWLPGLDSWDLLDTDPPTTPSASKTKIYRGRGAWAAASASASASAWASIWLAVAATTTAILCAIPCGGGVDCERRLHI